MPVDQGTSLFSSAEIRHIFLSPNVGWPFLAPSLQREQESGRTGSRRHMDEEPENVIYSYTDAQALEDGVLVAVDFAPVNRVTGIAIEAGKIRTP